MATALQGFRLTARSCQCRPNAHRYLTKSIGRRRTFSTAPRLLAEADDGEVSTGPKATRLQRRDAYKKMETWAPAEDEQHQKLIGRIRDLAENMDGKDELQELASDYGDNEDDFTDFLKGQGVEEPDVLGALRNKKKLKQTFLNMGDPEPFEDDDFEMEADTHMEMSTLAHGELEHHREMRHYARLAAWEMPLLSKFAKPFVKPTADMPLRFRYTTYMGEQHPAEKKVVLEFCTLDMPNLTHVQRLKLIKLAGVRYNPETDIVKMSCEMFPSQAQNKRYLGDLLDDMLREARDPKDTFEDVPVDIRHHKSKPKPKFPKEWVMTEDRRAELAKLRENAELKDQRRMLTGQLVDGIKQIEEAWAKGPAQPAALPEMAMAGGKGAKGKGKRVAIRR